MSHRVAFAIAVVLAAGFLVLLIAGIASGRWLVLLPAPLGLVVCFILASIPDASAERKP